MASASDFFLFCHISSKDAAEAFDFHLKFADNEYIWPRTTKQIESYAQNGELFAVRNSSGEIVGICYVTLDENRWELGGLGVSDDYRKYGLGSILTRFGCLGVLPQINRGSTTKVSLPTFTSSIRRLAMY